MVCMLTQDVSAWPARWAALCWWRSFSLTCNVAGKRVFVDVRRLSVPCCPDCICDWLLRILCIDEAETGAEESCFANAGGGRRHRRHESQEVERCTDHCHHGVASQQALEHIVSGNHPEEIHERPRAAQRQDVDRRAHISDCPESHGNSKCGTVGCRATKSAQHSKCPQPLVPRVLFLEKLQRMPSREAGEKCSHARDDAATRIAVAHPRVRRLWLDLAARGRRHPRRCATNQPKARTCAAHGPWAACPEAVASLRVSPPRGSSAPPSPLPPLPPSHHRARTRAACARVARGSARPRAPRAPGC